ncbi:MAG: hypothetical protein JNJ54_05645 [Myxococcaceae bacterium]|nr:hypothetical protein [Myxococcaceae bacterium]
MAPPVLLVADDLSTIAAVKRALGREGYEVILATSAADAVIAWGHHLPGLLLLQPSVESERGAVVLEELRQHPDAQLLRVVLLGESIPGFGYHVEPLPIDPEHFAKTVQGQMRAAEDEQEWTVTEPRTETTPQTSPPRLDEPEPWRATRPAAAVPSDQLPQTQELIADAAPTPPEANASAGHEGPPDELATADLPAVPSGSSEAPPADGPPEVTDGSEAGLAADAPAGPGDEQPPQASPSAVARLFGDLPNLEDELHRDVEAQAMATLDSSLPALTDDAELQRLEDEVRAEAARRRAAREARANVTTAPSFTPPTVQRVDEAPAAPADETSFADVGTTPPDGAADPTVAPAPAPVELQAAAPPNPELVRAVLERAEAISLEGRARAQAQRQTAEAERRKAEADREALERRAEHAESLVRKERETRSAAEDEVDRLNETLAALNAKLNEQTERGAADLEQEAARADEAEAALEARTRALDDASRRLADAEHALDAVNATAVERAAERESLLSSLTHEQEAARKAERELATVQSNLATLRDQFEQATLKVKELSVQLDQERLARLGVEEQRDELTNKLEGAVAQAVEGKGLAAGAQKLLAETETALAATRSELESARTDLGEAKETLEAVLPELERLRPEVARLTAENAALNERVGEVESELEGAEAGVASLTKDVAAHKEALEAQRARADEADALAQLSTERLKALEHRQVMNLALPGRRSLGLPRNGSVDLQQLAHLIATLASGQADARVELGVRGGTRTLWFKKGALHGAESSFDHESLVDRARRDGLIDARQEAELRLLRTATPREQLEAMKARGYLREIETIPLLQRATEAVALEAFSEELTQYRLSDDPPSSRVLLVAVPRATLPLLAEALRRALPADSLLERLGGAEAVCVATDHELDLRAVGFADKERKMLSWVDGEASVEDLTLAAGLKQEQAFRTLLVAKLLGLIEVKAPDKPPAAPSGDLDVRRLEAKYDEVQDADYFSILGLTRGATSEDVQRAARRLAEEFDPIKYTGHPDASLQQRAQVVSSLIDEAAKALEDERRRAEYARHLLD